MTPTQAAVKKSIVVNAPLAHAFKVFTEHFNQWWPRAHHIGKVEPYTAILEQREGGRWFERGADGSECEWGRVLVYSPPTRVTLSWHLDASYAYDPDPTRASRVEVSFHDEGAGRTRVELVHSQLDRHGTGWEKIRETMESPGAWAGTLEKFAVAAAEGRGDHELQ
jgi:Activator of Hsp90 ATPase homolog 1-like protein